MILRPHPAYRRVNAGVQLVLVAIGIVVAIGGLRGAGRPVAIAAVLGAGAWLLVRGLRRGVVVTGEQVIVRGMLRSRTIPRGAVVAVTGHPPRVPAIAWVDGTDRRRVTPLVMFADPQVLLVAVKQHNRNMINNLSVGLSAAAARRGHRSPGTHGSRD